MREQEVKQKENQREQQIIIPGNSTAVFTSKHTKVIVLILTFRLGLIH